MATEHRDAGDHLNARDAGDHLNARDAGENPPKTPTKHPTHENNKNNPHQSIP
jgi:hypothetical protein